GSWIRMNANGTIDRGVGGAQFQGMPGRAAAAPQPAPQPAQAPAPAAQNAINITSSSQPTGADANLAVAQIGFIARNDAQGRGADARRAGLTALGANQFVHADGSWLMLDRAGVIQRGAGNRQFVGIPGAQPRRAAPQPAPQPAPPQPAPQPAAPRPAPAQAN